MKKIRLLQISDIHWQKQLDAEDDYTDVRDQMLQDLKYYCEATKNNFDKILICGDIAFSGAEEEYIRANVIRLLITAKSMRCWWWKEENHLK